MTLRCAGQKARVRLYYGCARGFAALWKVEMPAKHPPLTGEAAPTGAVFHCCALQVNPHHYGGTYRGQALAGDSSQHVQKIVAKAIELGISVLTITDHNDVSDVPAFRAAAEGTGIHVFPGFELSSHEGVHVLCVYPLGTTQDQLGRFLGEFGIRNLGSSSDLAALGFVEVLAKVRDQGGVTIAAHATSDKGGLLKVLQGQARVRAWQCDDLLAIQIPGRLEDLPQELRPIVANTNPDYRRAQPAEDRLALAVVNAKDVVQATDLEEPSATCWIKMSEISITARDLAQIEERLAALPGLEETLKRFQEAGLEERLKEQSLLVREEQILGSIPERLAPFRDCLDTLKEGVPIDRAFLSPKAMEDLPGKDILIRLNAVFEALDRDLTQVTKVLEQALVSADRGVDGVRVAWNARKHEVQASYEKILRELQKSRVDGEEFIRLRRQIELQLGELILNGESSGVEFKRDDVPPERLAKEMAALLNLEGGFILLGVEKDRAVSGLTRHPTPGHYLSLPLAVGASDEPTLPEILDGGMSYRVLSMESYVFGRGPATEVA